MHTILSQPALPVQHFVLQHLFFGTGQTGSSFQFPCASMSLGHPWLDHRLSFFGPLMVGIGHCILGIPHNFGEALTSDYNLAFVKVAQILMLSYFYWFQHMNSENWLFNCCLIYPPHCRCYGNEIINFIHLVECANITLIQRGKGIKGKKWSVVNIDQLWMWVVHNIAMCMEHFYTVVLLHLF